MARKNGSISRPNAIKIGIVVLAILIVFGVYAGLTNTFVERDVIFTVPFDPELLLKPLPLELASNFSVECRIWVQGFIVDESGAKTSTGFQTQVFNPQFTKLDVINIQTEDTINSVESEIHARCDPAALNLSPTQGNSYTLTGGSLQYYWTAKDEDNTVRIVTPTVTVPISPSDNILQDSSGPGVILAKPTVTGKQIDDKLTSTKETYFTSATLVVLAKPQFQFKVGCVPDPNDCAINQKEFATVNLNAGIGTIKVFNEIVDPAKSTSQTVDLVRTLTTPSVLFTDSKNINLEVRIQLEQWEENQGVPVIDVFKPSQGANAVIVFKDKPITAKKLIDATTKTYEFFDTNIAIPDNPTVGTWIIKAKHSTRTGEDHGSFVVLQQENQGGGGGGGGGDGICPQGTREPFFTPFTVQDCIPIVDQTPCETNCGPSQEDKGISGSFPVIEFIACLKDARSDVGCLQDPSFTLIWAIIAVIVIIGIASAAQQASKPRY